MLRLQRKIFTDKSTIGELFFKENKIAWTLEDTIRKLKIPHKTAIPAGQYEVIMSYSQRFQRRLPLLLDVPFFKGIRIHAGNTEIDTNGCILVGLTEMEDFVGNSRKALDLVIPIIEEACKIGKLYICIMGGYSALEWGQNFGLNAAQPGIQTGVSLI